MKSNSPFKRHNINNLSVTKINKWISNPASVLFSLAGGEEDFGPSAWRGNAVESGFESLMTAGGLAKMSVQQVVDVAKNDFDKRILESFTDEKIQKERDTLIDYVKSGYNFYNSLGTPTSYQKRIEVNFDDLEIPFIGYIDFEFGKKDSEFHQIRDCKTSMRKPSKLQDSHCRQLSLYNYAAGSDNTELWIDTVTKKEVHSMQFNNPEPYIKQIINVALGLRKFLSISDDAMELCQMIHPDLDDWRWSNYNVRKQVQNIWRYKDEQQQQF